MDSELSWPPAPAPSPIGAPSPTGYPSRTDAPAEPTGNHAAHDPFGATPSRPLRKRIGGAVAGAGALLAKFATAIKALLVALPNLKLLTTAGTALVSIVAYSLLWGWTFAVGLVVLLFVHEMGHVIQLRREGIPASSPMFIPFLGAVIASRSLGDNALAEARVGLAGPILGSLGAAVCLIIAEATHSEFFRALAYVGFFLNLFNLIPIVPLDGGRAMAAMAPAFWLLGFVAILAMEYFFPSPILLIILVFGGLQTWQRWQARKNHSLEQAAYYRVSRHARLGVATVYIGLIVLLATGMDATYLTRTIS
jgi:Zn-dependent protease